MEQRNNYLTSTVGVGILYLYVFIVPMEMIYSGGWYSLFICFYCSHGDDSMKNTIKPDNYIIDKELQHTNYFICIRITCGKPIHDCINLLTMKVNTVTF